MSSDSDHTIDSDEFKTFLAQSKSPPQKKKKVALPGSSKSRSKDLLDSDSDCTIDSDEFQEFISQSQNGKKHRLPKRETSKTAVKKVQPQTRKEKMSDSEDEDELQKKPVHKFSSKKSEKSTNDKAFFHKTHQSNSGHTFDSGEFQEYISQSQKDKKPSLPKGGISKAAVKKVQPKSQKEEMSNSEDEELEKKLTVNISTRKREKCKFGKVCFRKNPDHIKHFYHEDNESDPEEFDSVISNKRPKCQYGPTCYRKNEQHRRDFDHGDVKTDTEVAETPIPVKSKAQEPVGCKNYGFFLTKVSGIPEKYNCLSFDIKDLLSFKDGTLISSAQFNYMFDIPWLMQQYPEKYRKCPLTIVHGEQRESKKRLEKSGANFPNIKFCQAKLDIPFGTHHTKMMFLLYKEGFKIVIHTSNIVDSDWLQRTQGMWVSPLLPELQNPSSTEGESPTHFKADLLEYLASYGAPGLDEWCDVIKRHDFSNVKVVLIGSVPGRHLGSRKTCFGHLKLRKVLNLNGSSKDIVQPNWSIICQFSSIGSLCTSAQQWMISELVSSLSTVKESPLNYFNQSTNLKLVFPTVENVRKSLQGYPAGASLPYSHKVAQKQPYLKSYMHQWKSEKFGRSEASPHIKTYLRVSPDNNHIAWFLLTSANLSKAAWGSMEKNGTQFMIRSYELGVLFLPKFFGLDLFSTPISVKNDFKKIFPVPYDIPLEPYSKNDEPWIWDIPHIKAPDRFGQMWCPP